MPKDLRIKAKLPSAADYRAFDVLCAEMGYTNRSEFAGKIILDRIHGRSPTTAQLPLVPPPKMSANLSKRRELRNELAALIDNNKESYQAFLCIAVMRLSSSAKDVSSLSSEFQEFAEHGFDELVRKTQGLVEYKLGAEPRQIQITAADIATIKKMLRLQNELAQVERKLLND